MMWVVLFMAFNSCFFVCNPSDSAAREVIDLTDPDGALFAAAHAGDVRALNIALGMGAKVNA